MKYKVSILLSLLMLIFVCIKVKAFMPELPLLGKVIYVDPGHGR